MGAGEVVFSAKDGMLEGVFDGFGGEGVVMVISCMTAKIRP